ncbi:MAG: TatD family hydrolase [Parabacteroides sp.]|nr:TatD family hydrolase [Parabacteroides sp.]
MIYYDIHTHQPPVHPEDIAIINTIVKDEGDLLLPAQWCSMGIHPWYIYNVREQLSLLESALSDPSVVAIGEAGLDKLAEASLDIQQSTFREQALLAEKADKPLIIHSVKAWAELIAMKRSVKPRMPWIVHGFRGNAELAGQLIHQGFYLSFGEHFNSQALQAAWPGYLLAETDDKEIDIRSVYRQIATSLHISLEELVITLERNVQNIFPFVR